MHAPSEFVQLMRNIAIDAVTKSVTSVWGYVNSYDAKTHSVTLAFPQYVAQGNPTPVSPPIPLGTFAVGEEFGARFAPGLGTPCCMDIVEEETGDALSVSFYYNEVFTPNTTTPLLTPGEFEFISGTNFVQRFNAAGQLQLGQLTNWQYSTPPSTPVAVEGSRTTGHVHALTALASAITAIGGPNTPLTNTNLASALMGIDTDSATDTIDEGQGAQSILCPAPATS
jgi:hypothetical protein